MARLRVSFFAASLVIGLLALSLGSGTQAQAPGKASEKAKMAEGKGFRHGLGLYFSPVASLSRPEVRKELKLTDDQLRKMEQAREEMRKNRRDQFDAIRKEIAEGGKPPDPALLSEGMKNLVNEEQEAVTKVLSRAQRDRLQQIMLQAEGPLAIARPEIQEKLNIGPDQSEEIKMIMDEINGLQREVSQAGREMFEQVLRPVDGGGNATRARTQRSPSEIPTKKTETREEKVQGVMKKLTQQSDQLERQAIREISRVLTKRQKQAFNKLLGEPFAFPFKSQNGPGGRGADANPKNNVTKTEAAPDSSPTPKRKTQKGQSGSRP